MDEFIQAIKEKIHSDLPGYSAHHPMIGYTRQPPSEARLMIPPARESAVMMLLYKKPDGWFTTFMKRTRDNSAHSGQISFPGGKQEDGETLEQTAKRETFEELGINPDSIQVLGSLSELYIPPSHFIVHPFIGLLEDVPHFNPNPLEVNCVIEEPLANFMEENIIRNKKIYIPKVNAYISAKCFDLQGEILWGATAMIVQEFRTIMGFRT